MNEKNTGLSDEVMDKIIVKRESTKEEIHLDIYLKMGQIYETVYQPQKSASKDNPLSISVQTRKLPQRKADWPKVSSFLCSACSASSRRSGLSSRFRC